ncbi:hypothetical protein AB0B12_13650 [Streptomyces sp. NPDC044780]|uniref:hypothetical protein n=1 Tax=unclassified Streptomyces TaxID=2593676 RepID=UPI0033C5796D
MRNNLRRSILVAAAATGIWALGSAAANAAENPAVPSTDGVTSTVDGLTKTVTKTVDGATGGVAGTSKVTDTAKKTVDGVASTVDGVTDPVKERVPGAANLPRVSDVTKTVEDTADGLTGDVAKPGKVVKKAHKAVKGVEKTVKKTTDLDLPTGEVPGVVPSLPGLGSLPTLPDTSALPTDSLTDVQGLPGELPVELPATPKLPSAPGSANDLLASLSGAGIRPEDLTGKVQAVIGTAKPVVDGVASDVLPPAAHRIVVKVVPVVQQTAGDAGALADGAVARTTPYAGVVTGSVQGFTLGTASNVVPAAQDTVDRLVPVVVSVPTTAVPFAQDLAGTTVPFAQDLATGTVADAQTTVGNVKDGALSLLPALPTDLTDVANIPALPALPADLPQVPAELPQLPADLPQVPAELPQLPAELPQVELPQLPAELPTLPGTLPTV